MKQKEWTQHKNKCERKRSAKNRKKKEQEENTRLCEVFKETATTAKLSNMDSVGIPLDCVCQSKWISINVELIIISLCHGKRLRERKKTAYRTKNEKKTATEGEQ